MFQKDAALEWKRAFWSGVSWTALVQQHYSADHVNKSSKFFNQLSLVLMGKSLDWELWSMSRSSPVI